MIVSNMISRNTHSIANAVKTILKLGRLKECEASVLRPFFAYEALWLKGRGPLEIWSERELQKSSIPKFETNTSQQHVTEG